MDGIAIKQTEESLSIVLEEGTLSNLEYKVIKNQRNEFFLPVYQMKKNGKPQLFFTIPASYNSLAVLAKSMEPELMLHVREVLELICAEVEGNGFLKLEHLDMNLNHIFLDTVSGKLQMLYLPLTTSTTMVLNREAMVKSVVDELLLYNENRHVFAEIQKQGRRAVQGNSAVTNPPYFMVAETGQKMVIDKDCFAIGKNREVVDGVIYNHSEVSRRHCLILKEYGKVYIRDEGSTNGTYVNGNPIKGLGNVELQEGDNVHLAECLLIFYEG